MEDRTRGEREALSGGIAVRSRRVLLVNPPSEPGTTANREGAAGLGNVYSSEGAFLYPPHTLAVVAAVLRRAGWVPELVDAVVDGLGMEALASRAADSACTVIGVFVSFATLEQDVATLQQLRRACPETPILVFGPAVRFVDSEVWERSGATAALRGEPERLFLAACERLAAGEELPLLAGAQELDVAGYDGDGWLLDLEALPHPAWDLLPWRKYRFLSVLSSRGCDDRCAYCPYVAAQGQRYRPRAASGVVAELGWLVEHFEPSRIVFRDPVFARDRQRVADMCAEIMTRPELGAGSRFTWECESRPEHFDAELLESMRRAGCGWIKIGLESTDERVLGSSMRLGPGESRDAYVARAAEVVRACGEVGIRCRVFVMVGLPGQTEASAAQTATLLRRMRPTALGVKALHSYPGSRWGAEAVLGEDNTVSAQAQPLLELKNELERSAAGGRRSWLRSLRNRLRERWK